MVGVCWRFTVTLTYCVTRMASLSAVVNMFVHPHRIRQCLLGGVVEAPLECDLGSVIFRVTCF